METADLSTALRSGRDDKGEWGASRESICWIKGGREVMNSGSHFATAADGSAPLPVVISTGEVMGLRPPKVMAPVQSLEAPPSPLSSRPKRSAVERSAVQRHFPGNVFLQSTRFSKGRPAPTNGAPAEPGACSNGSALPPFHSTQTAMPRRMPDRGAIDHRPAACFR